MYLVSIRTTWLTQQKQWGLYQNKVTSSLAAIQRPGHWADNCKIVYLKAKFFENDDVTIITWFPWPSFPQTQIQNFKIRCGVFSVRPLWNRPHQKQKLFLTPSLKLLFNCSVRTKTAWILRHTRAAFELRVCLVVYADGLCNEIFTYKSLWREMKEALLVFKKQNYVSCIE